MHQVGVIFGKCLGDLCCMQHECKRLLHTHAVSCRDTQKTRMVRIYNCHNTWRMVQNQRHHNKLVPFPHTVSAQIARGDPRGLAYHPNHPHHGYLAKRLLTSSQVLQP